jgi:cob(I)alamin adenosyltransferase
MPIYTRTGDKGTTSLFDKTRVLKSSARVETYGTIDELNSAIGAAVSHISKQNTENRKQIYLKKELEKIQHDLLEIGSSLANPDAKPIKGLKKRPKDFEKLIDMMTVQMPPLKNFILPGGSSAGAHLHIARTIARRAERRIVNLIQSEKIDPDVVVYINRLSDLLFTTARYANFLEDREDILWIKK